MAERRSDEEEAKGRAEPALGDFASGGSEVTSPRLSGLMTDLNHSQRSQGGALSARLLQALQTPLPPIPEATPKFEHRPPPLSK